MRVTVHAAAPCCSNVFPFERYCLRCLASARGASPTICDPNGCESRFSNQLSFVGVSYLIRVLLRPCTSHPKGGSISAFGIADPIAIRHIHLLKGPGRIRTCVSWTIPRVLPARRLDQMLPWNCGSPTAGDTLALRAALQSVYASTGRVEFVSKDSIRWSSRIISLICSSIASRDSKSHSTQWFTCPRRFNRTQRR